jgi:hypothetical protein
MTTAVTHHAQRNPTEATLCVAFELRGCLETKSLYEKKLCHIQGKAQNRLTG